MKIRDQALSGYKYNLMDQLICEYTVAPLVHACRLWQRQSEKKKRSIEFVVIGGTTIL